MVLEGLKRAEAFVNYLRKLGYHREDGRPLKPEQFDQDFSNKQYSIALNEMLNGLHARILTDEEMSKLEYIARLGLFDGLLEEKEDILTSDNAELMEDEELLRLEELNRLYEAMIDKLEIKERKLEAEIESTRLSKRLDGVLANEHVIFPNGHIDHLKELTRRHLELNGQVNQARLTCFSSLFRPIDNKSIDEPSYQYLSVSNEQLLRQPWQSDDYSFYVMKICMAIDILRTQFGIELNKDELLQDEYELAKRREISRQDILSALCNLERERLALNSLYTVACKRYINTWQGVSVTMEEIVSSIANLTHELQELIKKKTLIRVVPNQRIRQTSMDVSPLTDRLIGLEKNAILMEELTNRLVCGHNDVNIVSTSVTTIEEQLRTASTELSFLLQQSITAGNRIRLLFRTEK